MDWQNLINLAKEMAANPPSNPIHQTQLRLSVSSTYYAMYHALARSNADLLVGSSDADRDKPEWTRTYMALGGDAAVERLQEDFTGYSEEVQNFVETFIVVNEQRLLAEEDPAVTYTNEEALAWIERAETAIAGFVSADEAERKGLAMHLLEDHQR